MLSPATTRYTPLGHPSMVRTSSKRLDSRVTTPVNPSSVPLAIRTRSPCAKPARRRPLAAPELLSIMLPLLGLARPEGSNGYAPATRCKLNKQPQEDDNT